MTTTVAPAPPVLLAYPFRPFFLLTGLYAGVAMVGWIGYLLAGWPLPLGAAPLHWHAHEMIFGIVPAAIAGFLLTAMTNWTGAPPLKGRGLAALLLLWLAGRIVMWLAGVLPVWLVAVVDLAFLPVLALYAARVLLRYGNRRNLVLPAMLMLLASANLMIHLDLMGLMTGWARHGEVLAINLITVLMIVIAGRITPAFTANWLRMNGRDPSLAQRSERLDRYAVLAAALMIPADLITGFPALGAVVALLAAAVNGARLAQWGGIHTLREPLLWILHLGYVWLVVALIIKGLVPFVDVVNPTAWLHAMGTGAVGTLILGVMTRVAMGHTGRPLQLRPFGLAIYIAISLAAVTRVLVALGLADYRMGLGLAAIAWAVAFFLFVILYWPILSRPRPDGRPG